MPYIKSNDGRRKALQNGETALNAGELNYQIFYYIKHRDHLQYSGLAKAPSEIFDIEFNRIKTFVDNFLGDKPNYQRYNDMTGALLRCYKEVKRRLNETPTELLIILDCYDGEIAKYEDLKINENGDVE